MVETESGKFSGEAVIKVRDLAVFAQPVKGRVTKKVIFIKHVGGMGCQRSVLSLFSSKVFLCNSRPSLANTDLLSLLQGWH